VPIALLAPRFSMGMPDSFPFSTLDLACLRVDLDIESGTNTGYAAFATRIRTLWAGSSKPWVYPRSFTCESQ
jgi:hypothetical protein